MARAAVAHPLLIEKYVKTAISKKGFAVVEVATHCHTQFGRKNKRPRPIDNINFFKENSVMYNKATTMSKEELEGKIVIGEFVNADLPEYVEQYMKLIESLGVIVDERSTL